MHLKTFAVVFASLASSLPGADRVPVEAFARPDAIDHLKMSPDGEYIGYIREHEGTRIMCFADLATLKPVALQLPKQKMLGRSIEVLGFNWLGPKRVQLDTSSGWYAVDRDRGNPKAFGWQTPGEKGVRLGMPNRNYRGAVHIFGDGRRVLAANHRFDEGRVAMQFPDVVLLDTVTGVGTTVAKNPGSVIHWLADASGTVRAAVSAQDDGQALLYRAEQNGEWQTLTSTQGQRIDKPHAFTEDGAGLYMFHLPEESGPSVRRFDLASRKFGEPVWKNPVYEPFELVLEPSTGKLAGVAYIAEHRKTDWLDERYATIQAAVDRVLAGRVNLLSGFSTDLGRVLVKSSSDRSPTIAYLFNTSTGELREIAKFRPWVVPSAMASTKPITYVARDNVRVYGFLTVPHGASPKNMPLVVLLNDGLSHRAAWDYNPRVQFLASRGYGVLQVNQRGSRGYGRTFAQLANGETGGSVQNDIEDAVRWAISRKLADPTRVAVAGGFYGGYSVLELLRRNSGLFNCGIAISPVTNWDVILKEYLAPISGIYYRTTASSEDSLIDPTMSGASLQGKSPVDNAAAIKTPLLLVGDPDLPPYWLRQTRQMVSAMEAAGRQPELVVLPSREGSSGSYTARVSEFKAMEAFLLKHIPTEAPSGAAAGANAASK